MMIYYLGQNIGYISGMPCLNYMATMKNNDIYSNRYKQSIEQFNLNLKSFKKYKYLILVTANYTQSCLHDTIKNNGFRAVKEFFSAHGNKNETLTL